MGRRQLEARGASRDLDTWKWTRDDGGDVGDDGGDGDDAGDGDSDDDGEDADHDIEQCPCEKPSSNGSRIWIEPSFYPKSDSTLTHVLDDIIG